MKSKLIYLILMIFIFICLVGCVLIDEEPVIDYRYDLKKDDTYEIVETNSKGIFFRNLTNELYIPNTYKEKLVTSIGENAFYYNQDFDNGIYTSYNVNEIIIQEGIKEIKNNAFKGLFFIDSIYIPSSVEIVGDSIFEDCGDILIKTSLTSKPTGWSDNWNTSGNQVIWGVTSNDEIGITYGFVGIDEVAILKYNIDLTTSTIEIPSQIEEKNVSFLAERLFDKVNLEIVESIVIPNTIKTMRKGVFEGLINLINVEGLETSDVLVIPERAFYNCNSLEEIVIPNTVEKIGFGAFFGCSALTSLTIPFVGESKDATEEKALFGYIFEKHYYIPKNLATVEVTDASIIKFRAFYKCENIKNIILNDSILEFESYAFYKCFSLENIKMPNQLQKIGQYSFHNCNKLNNILIPISTIYMEDKIFMYTGDININCEAESKPSGWHDDWNIDNREVVWGYIGE